MSASVDCGSVARRRDVCIDAGEISSGELEPATARSMLSEMRGTPLSPGETWDREAREALAQFQRSEGLPPTGQLDDISVDRLKRRFEQFVDTRHAVAGDIVVTSPTPEAHRHVAHSVQHAVHVAEEFSHQLAHDSAMRARYMQEIQSWSKEIMARLESGQLTEAEASFAANQMRNNFLKQTRGELSPAGRLISTMLKREGLSLPAAIEKYAGKMFGKTTKELTKEEMAAVCARIAERSGVSNATVNTGAKLSPVAGKAILAAAIALAVYQVATADDKLREAVVQGAGFLGFWAGAKVGAAVGGAVCAGTVVGAPACAVVGGLVGGIVGAMAAESAADHTYGAIKG